MLKVRTQANDIALVGSAVNDLILPVEPGNRKITLAASEARFDRKAKAALEAKIEGKNWVQTLCTTAASHCRSCTRSQYTAVSLSVAKRHQP